MHILVFPLFSAKNCIAILKLLSEYCYCCDCYSVTKLCPTLWDPMDYSMPGFPVLHYLLEFAQFMSFESVMLSNHLILCCPRLLLSLVFPIIRVFFNKSALHIRWPKYWSFIFSISPFKSIQGWFPLTGLISLLFKGLSIVFSSTTVWKHLYFSLNVSKMPTAKKYIHLDPGSNFYSLYIVSKNRILSFFLFIMRTSYVRSTESFLQQHILPWQKKFRHLD